MLTPEILISEVHGVMQTKPSVAPGAPSHSDIQSFAQMLNGQGAVPDSVKTFVENAQNKLQEVEKEISGKLRRFDYQDDIRSLVESMHTSSLRSVSIQLTGKIGSKCSESFEQLIKQQ